MIRFSLCALFLLLFSAMAQAESLPNSKAPSTGTAAPTTGATVNCTVRSILGSQNTGGIDKRLSFLRNQFSKPPFSAYKSFKLLDSKDMAIAQAAQQQTTLPNGKILKLTFKERILGPRGRLKLRLTLSITPPNEKRFLPGMTYTITNRGSIVVAGDKHQGGTLAIGITCRAK